MGSNGTVYTIMPVNFHTSQFNTINNTMKTCFTSDERETVKVRPKILWQQSIEKFAHFAEVNMGVPAIYARIHGDNQ